MMNTDRLRGIIAEKGYSQRKIAAMLGMSEKTFYDKMKKGVFDSDEISEIIAILDIKKPLDIFFYRTWCVISTKWHAPLFAS